MYVSVCVYIEMVRVYLSREVILNRDLNEVDGSLMQNIFFKNTAVTSMTMLA